MTHRSARVSLYGVVVGVILGAGALAYTQDMSTSMEARVSPRDARFHGVPLRSDFTRRNVDRKGVPLRDEGKLYDFPTVQPDAGTGVDAPASDVSQSTCDAVQEAVLKIKRVYNAVIPLNIKNTEVRQRMDAVIADTMDDFCEEVGSSSSSVGVSPATSAPRVNNKCDKKYLKFTVRYTQCVFAEQIGKTYP